MTTEQLDAARPRDGAGRIMSASSPAILGWISTHRCWVEAARAVLWLSSRIVGGESPSCTSPTVARASSDHRHPRCASSRTGRYHRCASGRSRKYGAPKKLGNFRKPLNFRPVANGPAVRRLPRNADVARESSDRKFSGFFLLGNQSGNPKSDHSQTLSSGHA